MNYNQGWKRIAALGPGTLATNAISSARIDTIGFRQLRVTFLDPVASASNQTNVWQVAKLTESDNSTVVASNGSAIVAFTGTTNTVTDATNGYVIPAAYSGAASTSSGRVAIEMNVDLRGRKRYLLISAEPGAANSTVAVVAELTRAEEMPNTDTERNVGVSVTG